MENSCASVLLFDLSVTMYRYGGYPEEAASTLRDIIGEKRCLDTRGKTTSIPVSQDVTLQAKDSKGMVCFLCCVA